MSQGVGSFVLDESLAEVEYEDFERDPSALVYNEKPGWIWEYDEEAPPAPEGPSVIPTVETPDSSPPARPVMLRGLYLFTYP